MIGVQPLGRVQPRHRLERLDVARVVGEDALVGVDGGERVVQLVLGQLRQLQPQRPLRRRLGRLLDLLRQHAGQIAERALAEVEPLERVERRAIGVVEREHVAPGADGLLRLAERLLVQLGGAVGELLLLGDVVRQRGALLQDLHQLLVAALVGEQPLERLVRRRRASSRTPTTLRQLSMAARAVAELLPPGSRRRARSTRACRS